MENPDLKAVLTKTLQDAPCWHLVAFIILSLPYFPY